jgi:hypothetical protein
MSSIKLSAAIVYHEAFSQSLLDGMHRLGHDRHKATIARERHPSDRHALSIPLANFISLANLIISFIGGAGYIDSRGDAEVSSLQEDPVPRLCHLAKATATRREEYGRNRLSQAIFPKQ